MTRTFCQEMHTMKSVPLSLLSLFVLFAYSAVFADDHVETANIALYQPDDVLAERKLVPKDLAAYIQRLTKILESEIGANAKKETLDVVVAVRPGKKTRVWLVSSLEEPPARVSLAKKLESVAAIDVAGGPLAFAISLNIAGATRKGVFEPPMPAEWIAAAESKGDSVRVPEGIIEKVWARPRKSAKPKAEQISEDKGEGELKK